MQTFLPYPDVVQSVAALDNKRLGKQRVEALQIINALRFGSGWRHHPAVKMWRGYERALEFYMNAAIREWIGRGFRNTMLLADVDAVVFPGWFGDAAFHLSHRSNLLRKLPSHYGKLWPDTPDNLPYVWPV